MSEGLNGRCWKCTRCGWVNCYSDKDLSEYGEPSECGDNHHESLVEIDLVEGWAALADKATLSVRRAERDLKDAQAAAAQADQNLARATRAETPQFIPSEREEIVKWLRDGADRRRLYNPDKLADAIERGDYRSTRQALEQGSAQPSEPRS